MIFRKQYLCLFEFGQVRHSHSGSQEDDDVQVCIPRWTALFKIESVASKHRKFPGIIIPVSYLNLYLKRIYCKYYYTLHYPTMALFVYDVHVTLNLMSPSLVQLQYFGSVRNLLLFMELRVSN